MGQLVFQATLGGQVNLVGPNTASTFNLNVPAVSSTLATLTGTETFTNKTLTSPTLTTPVLGTPASGTLTNCTSLPVGGITATGTPSSTTYLRGDSTWATISTSPTAITNGTSNVTVNSSGGTITAATAGTTAVTIDTSQNFFVNKTTYSDTSGNGFGVFPNSGVPQVSCVGASNSTNKNFTVYSATDSAYKFYVTYAGNGFYSGTLMLGGRTSTPYGETLSIATANNQGIHINDTASSSNINYQYFTKGAGLTNVGAIYYNGTVMTYQSTSDYRLKENVASIENALEKISLLKPVTYTWKDNQRSGEGFIAHEFQEHFPDAVSGTKDGVDENGNPQYQGMDASVIIGSMVKAIQELKAIVDAQATRIATLEAK